MSTPPPPAGKPKRDDAPSPRDEPSKTVIPGRDNDGQREAWLKHLELIQAVITRMASNSFLVKGWTVTLVAAIVALAARDANPRFVLIALLPPLFFWWLDAFYLRQERLFRQLYEDMRTGQAGLPILSMKTDPQRCADSAWPRCLRARVVSGFYLSLLVTVGLLAWTNVLGARPAESKGKSADAKQVVTPSTIGPRDTATVRPSPAPAPPPSASPAAPPAAPGPR